MPNYLIQIENYKSNQHRSIYIVTEENSQASHLSTIPSNSAPVA